MIRDDDDAVAILGAFFHWFGAPLQPIKVQPRHQRIAIAQHSAAFRQQDGKVGDSLLLFPATASPADAGRLPLSWPYA